MLQLLPDTDIFFNQYFNLPGVLSISLGILDDQSGIDAPSHDYV